MLCHERFDQRCIFGSPYVCMNDRVNSAFLGTWMLCRKIGPFPIVSMKDRASSVLLGT